jgi:hypothetical protein
MLAPLPCLGLVICHTCARTSGNMTHSTLLPIYEGSAKGILKIRVPDCDTSIAHKIQPFLPSYHQS